MYVKVKTALMPRSHEATGQFKGTAKPRPWGPIITRVPCGLARVFADFLIHKGAV